jgi:hypothetical protein
LTNASTHRNARGAGMVSDSESSSVGPDEGRNSGLICGLLPCPLRSPVPPIDTTY